MYKLLKLMTECNSYQREIQGLMRIQRKEGGGKKEENFLLDQTVNYHHREGDP